MSTTPNLHYNHSLPQFSHQLSISVGLQPGSSMTSLLNLPIDSESRLLRKLMPFQLTFSHSLNNKFKRRVAWSLRSAADGSRLDSSPTDDSGGGTRLIRTIRAVRSKIIARLKELRKNLPVKLFSFLVGFYCATAFATVIGQTGDWDVLSAGLTVAVVEGIGALMYKGSLPLVDNVRNLIVIFNYWKAGLSLGLFWIRSNINQKIAVKGDDALLTSTANALVKLYVLP